MDIEIKEMTEEQAKKLLQRIVDWLDELDGDDFFSSEGWKHYGGFED